MIKHLQRRVREPKYRNVWVFQLFHSDLEIIFELFNVIVIYPLISQDFFSSNFCWVLITTCQKLCAEYLDHLSSQSTQGFSLSERWKFITPFSLCAFSVRSKFLTDNVSYISVISIKGFCYWSSSASQAKAGLILSTWS